MYMCVCNYIIINCDRDRFLCLLSLITGSLVRDREAVGSGLDRGTCLRDTSVGKRGGVRQ